ncbi:MAG: FmdB family transcriptional regulator [Opitutaceae bacterium]|jgi:hypothetical protein|nr:FmdB family transcriptional regulator [Opitutaceae bacterium]
MPIHEYYCPENHTIYQFFARTLAQGRAIPKCPDNPKWRLEKMLSPFAVTGRSKKTGGDAPDADGADDPRMEAAMDAMEREFSHADENDPRAMARMMRRMSELTGEKIDGAMEEVVRKLEAGADPESLEDELGDADDGGTDDGNSMGSDGGADADSPAKAAGKAGQAGREGRFRFKVLRRLPARRDPKLYDYSED